MIKLSFLLLLCTISITAIFSQEQTTPSFISNRNAPFSVLSILSTDYIYHFRPIKITKNIKASPDVFNLRSIMTQPGSLPSQASYNCNELAFFCRLEVKMEKAAKLPVKFRLGDVQEVDYLEGKYEGWRYNH